MAAQLPLAIEPSESVEELATEQFTENTYVQQELLPGGDPSRAIKGESTGRNEAVDMRMEQQVLSPTVQDGQYADVGAPSEPR